MVLVQKWPCFLLFFQAKQARKMSFMIFQSEKTPFQGTKTRRSKRGKIDIFPKGLTQVLNQKWSFFELFFSQEIQARKMSFTIFQSGKTPFQAIKTRNSESRKIDIFPKGLTHGFVPKMAIFPLFFFRQYKPQKWVLQYSKVEKCLSRL